MKNYIDNLNENAATNDIIVKYSPQKIIAKNKQNLFNCGYLFLEKIYYDLKINKICEKISEKYSFKYPLLIFSVLLAVSFITSCVLEKMEFFWKI